MIIEEDKRWPKMLPPKTFQTIEHTNLNYELVVVSKGNLYHSTHYPTITVLLFLHTMIRSFSATNVQLIIDKNQVS